MAVVMVQGVYALQGQHRQFPLGNEVGSYGAAKTYVNKFFSRGIAKDAIFAEVMIWSVGGKTYYRRFKDGQWSKWSARYSKLPNPRKSASPSRDVLAAVGRYVLSVDPDVRLRLRRTGKTDAVSVGRHVLGSDPAGFDRIVSYLREDGLVRNPAGADASIYSPPLGFDSTKGMRGWVSIMRGHVLDSEAGTPERARRVDEVKRALNYAGFLTRGRSISKVYAETAKQAADWLHTVSDHATRNPARRLVRNPYLEKVLFPSGNWQYRYSPEDVAKRHAKKASRIESLKGREASLRAGVKRDVAAGDVVALAVALILETYERPGNNESARAGHFGVTGWQCRHLDLHKNRAVIDYIAKSGVHQTKVITTPWIVRALAERQRQCNANGGRLLPTSAASVNSYLDSYDISAKDLRTFGANTEMQRELTAVRKAGPDLSLLKPRDVTKTLKAEFNAALGVVAAKLGHTTSVLRKQYLVQGIEPLYLETGTVLQSFA